MGLCEGFSGTPDLGHISCRVLLSQEEKPGGEARGNQLHNKLVSAPQL